MDNENKAKVIELITVGEQLKFSGVVIEIITRHLKGNNFNKTAQALEHLNLILKLASFFH